MNFTVYTKIDMIANRCNNIMLNNPEISFPRFQLAQTGNGERKRPVFLPVDRKYPPGERKLTWQDIPNKTLTIRSHNIRLLPYMYCIMYLLH